MSNDKITWDTYRSGFNIFDRLSDINEFALVADIPPVPELTDPATSSIMSRAVYDKAVTAIQEAKFFSEDELSLVGGPNKCGVTYNDDRFDFSLRLEGSRLMLRREGSQFPDFHEWYMSLMPQIPVLVSAVLGILHKVTEREYGILRAGFVFKFLLHDLQKDGEKVKNSQIMSRLVKGVPSDSGRLSEEENIAGTTSRTDVNITRWVERERSPGKWNWRLERYQVEAPANKHGAGLWVTLGYGGETYSPPDGKERVGFSGREFLAEWDTAYIDFLRNKAAGEFLATLTEGYTFKSTAGNLP